MGWATEMKVLLIVLVFSKWPLTTDTLLQEFSLAGMPLSEAEYEYFFQALTAHQVLHAVCLRRAILGCYDPAIQALDRYENHGIIPDGWICSDFPDNTSFPSFCDFALYRCIVKKYFTKRVLCPDEATQKSTKSDQDSSTPDDIVISATERSFELPDSTPTTSTEPSPEPLATLETAAVELSTPPLLTTADKEPLLQLLSSSAIEVASKLISEILAAFTVTTKPASESTTSEPLMELTPASTATATPHSSSELPTTTTIATTDEFLIELTSTGTIITEPELNLATASTVATTTQATTTALTESVPELATATELFPESTSDTTGSFFEPTTHTTATATTSNTEPCVVDYPETLNTSTDSISSTVQHSTSSTVTTTTVTTTTGSTSILPIHLATTPTKVATAATSSTTTAPPWPFDAPLPFLPPQSNSTMRILILSFIRNKKVMNGDMAGISTLPLTALGSGSILQQEVIQRPLPTNGLKDLFLRLHDKRVQQLIHKMQNGISGGRKKPQSRSSSLQLLRAPSPRSDSKNRLQR